MSKFAYLIKNLKVNNDYILKKDSVCMIINYNDSFSSVIFTNGINLKKLPNNLLCEFNIEKTGDAYDKKVCNICGRLLPTDMFDLNQNGKNNRPIRRPSCKDCRKIIDGIDVSSSDKKEWNKVKPNLTIWTCPICKKTTIPGLTSKVVLDHDHLTGKPRAWICDSCNTGLGRFKDDVKILQSAIDYLNNSNKK